MCKVRPTTGPKDCSSDHGPWPWFVDRDPKLPFSEAIRRLTGRTVGQSTNRRSVRWLDHTTFKERGNNGRVQSTTSAAPADHLTRQGNSSGTDGNQCQNMLYALQACQDQEDSPNVVTGTLQVFHLDVYALLDPFTETRPIVLAEELPSHENNSEDPTSCIDGRASTSLSISTRS
uniref:Integrase core domain containing protein n=1 Tax=Solanum tuberosum TaxID=4113 RepID=M1DF73_SOLTU